MMIIMGTAPILSDADVAGRLDKVTDWVSANSLGMPEQVHRLPSQCFTFHCPVVCCMR